MEINQNPRRNIPTTSWSINNKSYGNKLGSISATAANWIDRYLTAPGRLEAPNSSKVEYSFVAQRKTQSFLRFCQVFCRVFLDFWGHTTWQHHVYLCCGDELVEKFWELVSPMLRMKVPGFDVDYDVATLRRMLWCEQALALEKWALVGNGLMAQRPLILGNQDLLKDGKSTLYNMSMTWLWPAVTGMTRARPC